MILESNRREKSEGSTCQVLLCYLPAMAKHSVNSDKLSWLANQIFTAFPEEVAGLRFYILDCGCIYYQRVARDGELDPQVGIYRDAEDGACEICLHLDKHWKDRVLDKVGLYNTMA